MKFKRFCRPANIKIKLEQMAAKLTPKVLRRRDDSNTTELHPKMPGVVTGKRGIIPVNVLLD